MTFYLCAFFISLAVYPILISYLRKYEVGQYIRQEGPDLHGYKSGTPTMGGIVFVSIASLLSIITGDYTSALALILFGFIGFLDDLLSVQKRHSTGLTTLQKLILEVCFSVIISVIIFLQNGDMPLRIPFSHFEIHTGVFYVPLAVFVLVGSSNAVNLSDGLDGLAGTLFLTTALPYWFFLEQNESALVFASLSVMAFLFYNIKPARIFMGDTGSLALGGLLGTVALKTGSVFFLPLFASVYVLETVSVILQVTSFKLFHKRIFKMSPIHHHFELKGWSETRVVQFFSLANLVVAFLTFLGG